MDAFSFQRVQINRKGCNKCFSFPRSHFGDHAVMEGDTADQLYIVMALSQCALSGFPNRCKSFGQEVIQGFAFLYSAAELFRFCFQFVIRQALHRRLEVVNGLNGFGKFFQYPIIRCSQDFCDVFEYHNISAFFFFLRHKPYFINTLCINAAD